MGQKYFCAYHSYREWIENLSDAEKGRLFVACLEYSELGTEPVLPGSEKIIFPAIRRQIDRDREAYDAKCDRLRQNGSKGGQAKASNCQANAKQMLSKCPPREKGNNAKAFNPPTPLEVEEYCKERKNNVDPQKFYDYYNASGWVDGNGKPIRNWKQKMISVWEKKQEVKQEPVRSMKVVVDPEQLRLSREAFGE